jgi:hypothetical protein
MVGEPMTTPQPDGNLPAALEQLALSIGTLTNPGGELAGRPDCPSCHNETCEPDCIQHTCIGHYTEVPALYERLYDSIPGSQGSGGHAARSMPPLWIDAARLLAWIDTTIRRWQPDYDRCTHCKHCTQTLATIRRLETLQTRKWRPQDTTLLLDYSNQLEAWAAEITLLLTPQRKWSLPNPCPACGTTTIHRKDSSGELVRQPALQIGPDGCHCARCKHTWGPQYFEHLARVLGYELPAGVLE